MLGALGLCTHVLTPAEEIFCYSFQEPLWYTDPFFLSVTSVLTYSETFEVAKLRSLKKKKKKLFHGRSLNSYLHFVKEILTNSVVLNKYLEKKDSKLLLAVALQ